MRVIHRISFDSTEGLKGEFQRLGLALDDDELVSFEIDETDEAWPGVKLLVERHSLFDYVHTVFSDAEIAEADILQLYPDRHDGYPQPERQFKYREMTYDVGQFCATCGIGLHQKAPFRLKREPNWKDTDILQLNWVFDEYFVKPEIWERTMKPIGVSCCPVLDRVGATLRSVVQVDIRQEIAVVTEGLVAERCLTCRREKYLPVTRGPLFALYKQMPEGLAKTTIYFGSGALAYRGVFASRELWEAFRHAGVRGIGARPVMSPHQ